MTVPGIVDLSCTIGENKSPGSPRASEKVEPLNQKAFGQQSSTHAVIPPDKMFANGRKAESSKTEIDSLKLKVEQCKRLLHDKDATIEAQCFHIGALYCDVSRLTNEKEETKDTVVTLRNQLKDFQEEDWQLHSGVRKKRKFHH